MKLHKNKAQLLIGLLAVGFLLGIIYENIVSKNNGASIDLFQTYALKQFSNVKIIVEEYFIYVLKVRLLPLVVLSVLGHLKWGKVLVSAFLVWTGFLSGVVTVSAIIGQGLKGILLCVAGIFPHILFYVAMYSVLLPYLFYYPTKKWNHTKTIFVIVTLFLGVMMETYLNPMIIKYAIQLL